MERKIKSLIKVGIWETLMLLAITLFFCLYAGLNFMQSLSANIIVTIFKIAMFTAYDYFWEKKK